ncbi:hypothetical protein DCC81_24815 [Chitinophaga parva]|uniref:Uncharacterized protein n=1 Tax=Chitinophaga parva TaxID=2169414 RepID=A0A2T7BBR3_9BACT|nr:SGNH/GDSL hydrolase family protein [Chitinophaga parva]PUZ21813.1 hypothetical protein DCC81_24815 [Chitinophaga parva]
MEVTYGKGDILKVNGQLMLPLLDDVVTAPSDDNAVGVYEGLLYLWDADTSTWKPAGDKTPDYVNAITRAEINAWNSKLSPYSSPAYYFQTYLYTLSSEQPAAVTKDMTVTIYGDEGSTSIAVSGANVASFAGGPYPVVIYDGTTYQTYYLLALNTTGDAILSTPLRTTVVNGAMKSMFDGVNSQHLTDYGYRALADALFSMKAFSALKNNSALVRPEINPATIPFTLTAGTQTAGFVPGTPDLAAQATIIANTQNAAQLGSHAFGIIQGGVGRGITWTVPLGAKSGYFETYVGMIKKAYNAGASFTTGDAVIQVTVDGVLVYNETLSGIIEAAPSSSLSDQANYPGKMIRVPFANANSLTFSYTTGTNNPTALAVNRTGIYITATDPEQPVFSNTDVIAFFGNSWTQYQDGHQDWSTRFKTLFGNAGGDTSKVFNWGRSGMTSVWGKYWLDSLVTAALIKPTVIVLEFFTNDNNSIPYVGDPSHTEWNFSSTDPYATGTDVDGKTSAAGWLSNIIWMVNYCLQRGIQPVIAMPAHTASLAQTQTCFDNLLSLIATDHYYDVKAFSGDTAQVDTFTARVITGTESVTTPQVNVSGKIVGGTPTVGGSAIIETQETNSGTAKGVIFRPDSFRQFTGSAGHILTAQNGTGTAYTDVWWVDNAANTHMRGLWLTEGIRGGIKSKNAAFTFDETYFAVYCNIGTNTSLPLGKASDYPGKMYYIKNVGTGNFSLFITPNGSDTINGKPTICIPSYGDCVAIMSDGVSNWIVLSITTRPYEMVIPAGEDGTQTHASDALQGTFWLERRGAGSLRSSEWAQSAGGGFTLTTSGDVLHAGEVFFAHFY